ncbi:glutathione S-transferase [Paxillus ammoniavirescens]|nr:glutathione S-transferase [Paxillus ammoniavirescens]
MGIPDEQIHPVATGRAAETAAQHQSPQDLTFWSGWFCPFNQRVWIALEEKGIPYQYKEVNPYKKEKHFLELNPKGLVPTIEYKGKALYESLVLCEFLEEAYQSYKPSLLPADPYERARVRIWIDHTSKNILPAWQRLLMAQDKEKEDAARQELYEGQKKLADQVKGPYFLGEEFSLVDVANAPWALREYILVEHRGYNPEGAGAKWKAYTERLSERDSVIKTTSDPGKLQVIYDRYLRDEAQSEAAKAIRAGRPMP